MSDQRGLEWTQEIFGLKPGWTEEPNVEIIQSLARKNLTLDENARCEIRFHAEGAFNKLYKVTTDDAAYLMRIALPVDPHYKTESEVATIKFVQQETTMPVPRIIAYDASNENELGFEWILMELMPGRPLRERWRKIPLSTKEDLIKQLARYQAELYTKKFDAIGNIYQQPVGPAEAIEKLKLNPKPATLQPNQASKSQFELGRLVSLIFFWGDHLQHNVPRGPFHSSHDWLHTRLSFILNDQERILKESDDEDDIEDAEIARDITKRLLSILPTLFPQDEPLSSVLFHDDLSMQNILVDEDGKLTAIIDWECVSALPLWRACQVPELLEGCEREQEPKREEYSADEPEDDDNEPADDALDNEGVDSLYWEHLLQYEQTQLRRLFANEVEKLQPGWKEESKKGESKADFDKAVHNADDGFCFKIIKEWLDAHEQGETWSLRKRMSE